MPSRTRLRVPFRPTLLALCCSASLAAHAAAPVTPQDANNHQDGNTLELGATNINADAPAPNALPPVYAGGQVARGGQLGVLGNQDIMDVPFSMSSYTEKLIRDQQAQTVGDVLLNDSSVRQASGYANQAQAFSRPAAQWRRHFLQRFVRHPAAPDHVHRRPGTG